MVKQQAAEQERRRIRKRSAQQTISGVLLVHTQMRVGEADFIAQKIMDTMELRDDGCCYECNRPYGEQYGFPDLVIPDAAWAKISPTGHEGGLLCPSCICKRLWEQGVSCTGRFLSGPLVETPHDPQA